MRKSMITVLLIGLLAATGAATAEPTWEAGLAALKAGNLEVALKEFQEVAAKQPDWPGGHFMVGQVYLKQGKAAEAVAALRKANELDASNPSYQFALGQAYFKAGRYADSAQILQKLNPGSLPKEQQGSYHQILAAALDKSGNDSVALDSLRKAAQAKPDDADVWFQYGVAAFNNGDTGAGVTALEKAVRLDGGDPAKKVAYAKALIRQGREKTGGAKQDAYAKAVGAAKGAVSQSATFENLLLLAEAQLGSKDYSGAASSLETAIAKRSSDWLPYFYQSQALTSLERYPQAESAARSALAKATSETDKRQVWRQVGFIAEKLKNFDESILAYRNAGDSAGAQRVEENKRIAEENQQIESHNKQIEAIEAERKKLEEQLKGLPGGGG